jgi:hypothetical protein
MSDGFVKIPLSLLQEGLPLARELYLKLPKNHKMIRIVLKHDELRPALLTRLRESGAPELFALPEPGDPRTPAEFPLYGAPPAAAPPSKAGDGERAPSEPDAALAAAPPADPAGVVFAAPSREEEQGTILSGRAPSPADEGTALPASSETEALTRFEARDDEDGAGDLVPGAPDPALEAVKIGAGKDPEELVTELSADPTVDEPAALLPGASPGPAASSSLIRSGESLAELSRKLKSAGDATADGAALSLGGLLEEAQRALVASAGTETAPEKLLPLLRELEDCVRVAGSLPPGHDDAVTLFTQAREALENAVVTLRSGLAEQEEIYRASPAASSEDQATQEWKVSAPAGDPSRNGRVYKEQPQAAARMAVLLALSLGYASLDFLSDLALTAIVVFSPQNGSRMEEKALPRLARAMLAPGTAPEEASFEDSRAILEFLGAYFENPECDRTMKEFSKRVFSGTLERNREGETGVDAWTAARWEQFVNKGPTMTALSLSAKAYTRASRSAKTLWSDAAAEQV